MVVVSPVEPQRVWPVAALYAGFFLNAGLLEYAGVNYYLAAHLWRLSLALLLYALFLCAAVFYVPTRLGNLHETSLEQLVQACVGARAAWAFQKVIVPVWAAAWFAYLSVFAIRCLELSIFHRDSAQPGPGITRHILIALIWFAMIAPAASGPMLRLTQSAMFLAKVSFVVVLGLALSSARYAPNTVAWIHYEDPAPMLPLESHLLLWAVAPLLLSGQLMQGVRSNRRALAKVMLGGIAAPLVFATLAAVVTMAGAADIEMRYRKIPDYLGYAYARPHQLGWVKVLLLTFTLLTASRLAANLTVGAFSRRRGVIAGTAATALLLIANFTLGTTHWDFQAWQYTAIPFAPLAGVLCGVYATARAAVLDYDSRAQRLALLAWVAGCVATCIPTWWGEFPDYSGMRPAWVLLGWSLSFTVTCATHFLRRRSTGN